MCFSWQEAGVLHCGLQMTRRALTAVGSDLKVRKVTARKVFSHIKPNFRNNYGCILLCFFSGVHRSPTLDLNGALMEPETFRGGNI